MRVSVTARPMSAAPTNPALGSTVGSRVVTTRPTRIHTTAAAAKQARFAVRSRGSITIESRASDPSVVTHGRIQRARVAIADRVPQRRPDGRGWTANDERDERGRRVGWMPYRRATLAGHISRNAQEVPAEESGLAVKSRAR